MRDSGSILGLTGVPLLVALMLALPFATRRPAGPVQPQARDTVTAIAPLRINVTDGFHVGRDLLREVAGDNGPDSLEILIALLPDPDESSLDWMYDANLAALRRGLEVAGYLSDRSWFPPHRDTTTTRLDGAVTTRAATDLFPGVMVFRGHGGASTTELALVYVVPEIPTAGVHRVAFEATLHEVRALLEGGAQDDTVRILGPTFSGSAPSLRTVLTQREKEPCLPVRIISGSATSPAARRSLDFWAYCTERGGSARDSARVTFGATVHTDAEYAALIGKTLLEPLGIDKHSVAILTESNTLYGASDRGSDPGSPEASPYIPDRLQAGDTVIADAMTIAFPLNVSSVRSAYDRNPEAQPENVPFRGPSSRLPLELELERRPREGPPARSRLTAPMLDQVIQDMLATLRRRRIRAVGIMATDVRDKLFLAELIHEGLPDALLFTNEGNGLFARRDLIGSVRGMVVASSYPLILQGSEWSRDEHRIPFGAEGAPGLFNATLFHLGAEHLAYQYRFPGGGDGASRDSVRVPLWLTTIGTGEILPLKVVDAGEDPEVLAASRTTAEGGEAVRGATEAEDMGHPHAHGRPGVLEVTSVAVAFVLPLWLLWVLFVRVEPGERPSRRLGFGALTHNPWSLADTMALVVVALSLFAPLGMLHGFSPAAAPDEAILARLARLLVGELVVGLGLLLLLTSHISGARSKELLVRAAASGGSSSRRSDWLTAVSAETSPHVLALVLGVFSLCYCAQLADYIESSPIDAGLYRVRTLNLASGVSGLVPLLVACVAIVLMIGWHRDRRRLLHIGESGGTGRERARRHVEIRQSLDLLAERLAHAKGLPSALDEAIQAILATRRRLEVRVPYVSVVVGLLVTSLLAWVLVAAYDLPQFKTIENVSIGDSMITTILAVALGLSFLSVASSLLHILGVWSSFKDFLHALADTPLAPAFDRIPERLRTMGRLHLFDPTSDRPGRVLAEAGHESVWREARANFSEYRLDATELEESTVVRHIEELKGTDLQSQRSDSLRSLIWIARESWEAGPRYVWESRRDSPDDDAPPPGGRDAWLSQVEDVLALEATRYVDWVLRNFRRLVIFQLFALLLTTALLEAMPTLYHAALTTSLVILMGVSVITVVLIMLQLGRDEVLSRITGTAPGKLNWHGRSILNALIFVALPVLGLLGTEVDPVGRNLFGWVQDLLRVLSVR